MRGSNLIKQIIGGSLIPLNSLLLFFLFFESRITLPGWLQVFGRMHPLLLHFPIVLILIYAVLTLFFPSRVRREKWYKTATETLLLAAAFTSAVTALMGFALSSNEDYDEDALAWHKWTGVFIPFILYLFYNFRDKITQNIIVARSISMALSVLILLAGHHGAVITHGENFILAPLTPLSVKVVPPFEEAIIYNELVQPVFENKCVGCHNNKKSKGDLVMDTRELFLKGGEGGVPWDTTRKDLGLLMQRVHLPLENKEHMPPKGKPQLTDDEIFIIHEWIRRGADFTVKFTDLLPSDTLYAIGKKVLPSGEEEKYDFAAADESQYTKLNNSNRVIAPVASGSPALSVTYFNRSSFNINALKELTPVNDKIVELNLPMMDVKDEHVTHLTQFSNLRRLNLNFTSITGKTLEQLKSLAHLKTISLSGTAIPYSALKKLQDFPKLRKVYFWSTPAAAEKIDDIQNKNKNISWYTGFTGDTIVVQLTPPILENEEQIITKPIHLKLKHYIRGAVIAYTLDGTDPDSLRSAVYSPGVIIDSNLTLKAKAFRTGWISSDVTEYHFYKKTFIPDSVELLTRTNKRFKATGGVTINDNIKSDLNTNSGKWLGYDSTNFKALLRFGKPIQARSVTLSVLDDVGGWIFPPSRVEVWGGNNKNDLKLLKVISPVQPKGMRARTIKAVTFEFPVSTVRYLQLVAIPVKLPSWHPEKGKRGYFFVDEIFVN